MNALKRMDQTAGGMLILYGLLLIPTLLLLNYSPDLGTALSRHITDTWNCTLWNFPGTSTRGSIIISDGLRFLTIGLVGWIFFRGYQTLSQTPEDDAQGKPMYQRLMLWSGLFVLMLLAVVPFHSTDLYGYINRGAQQAYYGVNPYQIPVGAMPGWQDEPMFHAHWLNTVCPYPFLFARLAQGVVMLSGHNFIVAFVLFKALNGLALLGSARLVHSLAKKLGQKRPDLSLYLFAWNPLILLHSIANGHNDILLAFFLLAALRALLSERWLWMALPLLTLSISIKYASLVTAPFILIYLWKQRRVATLALGLIASGAFALVLANPYFSTMAPGGAPANFAANAGRAQHSLVAALAQVVQYAARPFMSGQPLQKLVTSVTSTLKLAVLCGFAGVAFARLRHFIARPATAQGVVFESALALGILILVVSARFHSWYLVMFCPVAFLLEDNHWLRRFAVILSFFHLAAFTSLQNLHILNVILLTGIPLWMALSHRDRWFFRHQPAA